MGLGTIIGLSMLCLTLCHLVQLQRLQRIIQFDSGTIIEQQGVIHAGHINSAIIVRIPQLGDFPEYSYTRPCSYWHQFSTDLLYLHQNSSTGNDSSNRFSAMCRKFAQLKRINLSIRRHFIDHIGTAKENIRHLLRSRRSIFSAVRHFLNIGDYDAQTKMKSMIDNLNEEQFNTRGQLNNMKFFIEHQSSRIINLEKNSIQAINSINTMSKYINHATENENTEIILRQYHSVMLHEALNSGFLVNQLLDLYNEELNERLLALTTLARG